MSSEYGETARPSNRSAVSAPPFRTKGLDGVKCGSMQLLAMIIDPPLPFIFLIQRGRDAMHCVSTE